MSPVKSNKWKEEKMVREQDILDKIYIHVCHDVILDITTICILEKKGCFFFFGCLDSAFY